MPAPLRYRVPSHWKNHRPISLCSHCGAMITAKRYYVVVDDRGHEHVCCTNACAQGFFQNMQARAARTRFAPAPLPSDVYSATPSPRHARQKKLRFLQDYRSEPLRASPRLLDSLRDATHYLELLIEAADRFEPQKKLYFNNDTPLFSVLTNLSPYLVVYDGKQYPTSEQLFYALKFLPDRTDIASSIRRLKNPAEAARVASAHTRHARQDWASVERMEAVLVLKFGQHPTLLETLLSTGRSDLIFDKPDVFWGVGPNRRSGANEFGKALMRVRRYYSRLEDSYN
ncbi:hypothetical protein BOTBODRAFT_163404 [Botryobasidium botryosum FD-172 SS1]|uniref:NADAR domain-containing protein n=1 Tax=Botryobasidium botryosum (strain FD-172 SS1) TaxID=930990 RepID=A0A067M5U3_BOTB1|nr:hypothetical protein BOTBODRAFT_163404 [Botryobasidium botryosum FD-172 SS1]